MKYEDINWYDINSHQDIRDLPQEVWKYSEVINSYFNIADKYEVSSYGRVRRVADKFVFKITDNGAGYKKVALTPRGTKNLKNFYIHRVVADCFHPNPDNLPQVNHKPSGLGKFDNRQEHLEWCSEKDNILDAHRNGQMVNRTVHNTSTDMKSDEFVEAMYRRYKDTGVVGATAREFGVSRTTLSSIVNKRSRRSVTDSIDEEYKQN